MHRVENEDAPSRSRTVWCSGGGDRLLHRDEKLGGQRGRGLARVRFEGLSSLKSHQVNLDQLNMTVHVEGFTNRRIRVAVSWLVD